MLRDIETSFTPTQRETIDLMWAVQTEAKIGRRFDVNLTHPDPFQRYRFEHVIRPTRPIDFAQPGEFVLKLHERRPDAELSLYYINLRELPDILLTRVAESIAEATDDFAVDVCAGIPKAGDPIAKKYSEITNIPQLHLFGKAESGSNRKIVAAENAEPGQKRRLILIDDLITEADTKFEAALVAKELGFDLAVIGVLVDREQGGVDQLKTAGIRVAAPLPISRVFAYHFAKGNINSTLYRKSMDYLNDARTKAGLSTLELLAT